MYSDSATVTTISQPYSAPKGKNNNGKAQVKSRPSLRRPKVAIVAAAEAEVAAAKAGVTPTSTTKASDSALSRREEAEGAEQTAASTTGGSGPPSELRDTGEEAGTSGSKVGITGEDYSKLRCSSVTTEELAEREKARSKRRQNRCPDYPGLAFGAAMGFGSDTMMKFNIIKNELHNIMRSQLKRVDGEVVALSERIKLFDENLEKSEHYIKIATSTLAEAVQLELERKEREGDDSDDDSALSQFDAQMALLEGKLLQAKALAEESSLACQPTTSSITELSAATSPSNTSSLPVLSELPVPENSSERIATAAAGD